MQPPPFPRRHKGLALSLQDPQERLYVVGRREGCNFTDIALMLCRNEVVTQLNDYTRCSQQTASPLFVRRLYHLLWHAHLLQD